MSSLDLIVIVFAKGYDASREEEIHERGKNAD